MSSHNRSITACFPLRCLPNKPKHIKVSNKQNSNNNQIEYRIIKPIGAGTFGKVYMVVDRSAKIYALKVIALKFNTKSRQLQIMKKVTHSNIICFRTFYYQPVSNFDRGETSHYLNIVMDCMPESLYQSLKGRSDKSSGLNKDLIKIYMFQLFKAFAYLEKLKICHRDLKPSNILVDPKACILKVCDFGSAKVINQGERNTSYICSRYYRAPELLLGIQKYDMSVDVWSIGCILIELLTGTPIFPGESSLEQMIEIVKIIGTPPNHCLQKLYQSNIESDIPAVQPCCWAQILKRYEPQDTYLDLIQKILCYDTTKRIKASQALYHPYFQDLHSQKYISLVPSNPEILLLLGED